MGLAGELAVPGLAAWRTRSSWCDGQEVVETCAGEEQEPVSSPGARDGEAPEGGVELVECGGPGERVDRDSDGVRLSLPGVDRGGDEHTLTEGVLVVESVDDVLGVV